MRKLFSIAVILSAALLLTGCIEFVYPLEGFYFSAARDGGIYVTSGGKAFYVNADLSHAELIAEDVLRIEAHPESGRLLCIFKRSGEDGTYAVVEVCDEKLTPQQTLARHKFLVKKDEDGKESEVAPGWLRPRWSPDGMHVSYLWPENTAHTKLTLHVREVEGERALEIPVAAYGYAWIGPRAVALFAAEEGLHGLATVEVHDIEGDEKLKLATVFASEIDCLAWREESDEILFSSTSIQLPATEATSEDAYSAIFAVDVESKTLRRVTPINLLMPLEVPNLFEVDPEGARIIFTAFSGSEDKPFSVYEIPGDDNEYRRIKADCGLVTVPRWLPGGRFAFAEMIYKEEEDDVRIWVSSEDRTQLNDITDILKAAEEAAEKAREAEKKAGSETDQAKDADIKGAKPETAPEE